MTDITHEPHRLGSNQYLPDFLFEVCDSSDEVYVEVKPIVYANEAWLAIDAARETGSNLMVVDDFGRDQWYCYASVSTGELDFYSRLKEHGLEIAIPETFCRPIYYFSRPWCAAA
jgi:hypothetical protein